MANKIYLTDTECGYTSAFRSARAVAAYFWGKDVSRYQFSVTPAYQRSVWHKFTGTEIREIQAEIKAAEKETI